MTSLLAKLAFYKPVSLFFLSFSNLCWGTEDWARGYIYHILYYKAYSLPHTLISRLTPNHMYPTYSYNQFLYRMCVQFQQIRRAQIVIAAYFLRYKVSMQSHAWRELCRTCTVHVTCSMCLLISIVTQCLQTREYICISHLCVQVLMIKQLTNRIIIL